MGSVEDEDYDGRDELLLIRPSPIRDAAAPPFICVYPRCSSLPYCSRVLASIRGFFFVLFAPFRGYSIFRLKLCVFAPLREILSSYLFALFPPFRRYYLSAPPP